MKEKGQLGSLVTEPLTTFCLFISQTEQHSGPPGCSELRAEHCFNNCCVHSVCYKYHEDCTFCSGNGSINLTMQRQGPSSQFKL